MVDDNHDQNDNGEYLYDLIPHKGKTIRGPKLNWKMTGIPNFKLEPYQI